MIKKVFLITMVLMSGLLNGSAKNAALIVGIGDYNYEATGWPTIHGNNDVILLEEKFQAKGFEVTTLTDSDATKANIVSALTTLTKTVGVGDIVYVHFSGHGQPVEDMNEDEEDGLDQSFVCYDACFSTRYNINGQPYVGQNHLIDDEIFPFINTLKKRVGHGGLVIVTFDSCFSGGADRGDAVDDNLPNSEIDFMPVTRGSCDEFGANDISVEYLRSINAPDNYNSGGGNVLVLSACPRDRKNFECRSKDTGICYGSLSFCVSKMMDNDIPFDQWADFFTSKKFREYQIFRFSQRPVVEHH